MNPWVRICTWLYRRLARAYPHEFRLICGDEMERMGEDAAPEVWRRYGFTGLVRLLADIAFRLPAEYFSELRQDVRYSIRRLSQAKGFTAVAVLSLALGITMCVMFFQNIYMQHIVPGLNDTAGLVTLDRTVSYPYFESYRELRDIAPHATAHIGPVPLTVGPEGAAERAIGHLVSVEYFSTLGVTPLAGRFFQLQTEKSGAEPVVVISERFWRTRWNSDPQAVGRTIRVNGQNAKVIGIGPERFRGIFPMPPVDLFLPVTVGAAVAPELRDNVLRNPDRARFRLVMRLADGVTMQEAEAALEVVTRRLDDQKPGAKEEQERPAATLMEATGLAPVPRQMRTMMLRLHLLLLLMVLWLACANLANLLLARGNQRQREIAIRLSVGASRFRLVRQLLTESVMLALLGGVVSLGFSYALSQYSQTLEIAAELGFDAYLDPVVVGFVFLASLTAAAGFGLTPALASARTDVVTALKDGGAARLRGYRRLGIRNLFVVYQVAASLMILMITGYVVVGYQRSTGIDPGFDTENLYLFAVDPLRDGYSAEKSARLLEELPERLSRLEEVRNLTIADRIPFGEMAVQPNTSVSTPTAEGTAEQAIHRVFRLEIGANYFATLEVPLLRGREFNDRELRAGESDKAAHSPGKDSPAGATASPAASGAPASAAGNQRAATPAVINQTAARELFGDSEPIGGRIRRDDQTYVVVGIVQDVKSGFLMGTTAPTVFLPLMADTLSQGSRGATVVVRGAPGRDSMSALRAELDSIDSALTIFDARTMREHLGRFNQMIQWSSLVNGSIGVFGLILSSIGLAAVTAYAVVRRRKEIGIRMALGARRLQVLRLVMKEGTVLVLVGAALGFLGAVALARAVSALTAEFAKIVAIGTGDPLLVVGAPILLVGLALLACYLPARRSTKVDPLLALREE